MPQRHNIEDVISVLRRAQGSDRKAALIIGAGCSKSAGIPLAKEFVEIIKSDYEDCYKRAKEKTYPGCMAALLPVERKELLEKYIDNAKINWAHMGMACLMAADIV
ncbi:MAG: hypothetical protein IIC41_06715, partial [Candidatus Marinimicrobia bacterium]|nr:hypothetical protein [Candidatus Neomarinimicrobiota bacterium]